MPKELSRVPSINLSTLGNSVSTWCPSIPKDNKDIVKLAAGAFAVLGGGAALYHGHYKAVIGLCFTAAACVIGSRFLHGRNERQKIEEYSSGPLYSEPRSHTGATSSSTPDTSESLRKKTKEVSREKKIEFIRKVEANIYRELLEFAEVEQEKAAQLAVDDPNEDTLKDLEDKQNAVKYLLAYISSDYQSTDPDVTNYIDKHQKIVDESACDRFKSNAISKGRSNEKAQKFADTTMAFRESLKKQPKNANSVTNDGTADSISSSFQDTGDVNVDHQSGRISPRPTLFDLDDEKRPIDSPEQLKSNNDNSDATLYENNKELITKLERKYYEVLLAQLQQDLDNPKEEEGDQDGMKWIEAQEKLQASVDLLLKFLENDLNSTDQKVIELVKPHRVLADKHIRKGLIEHFLSKNLSQEYAILHADRVMRSRPISLDELQDQLLNSGTIEGSLAVL